MVTIPSNYLQKIKKKNQTKSKIGHFSKKNLPLKKYIKEFRLDENELEGLELGKEFDVNIFEEGQLVDVSESQKGKVLLEQLKDGILLLKMRLMVIYLHIENQVQ